MDICQNSELVEKDKTAVMEKTCYRLWEFLYSLPVINLQPDKPIREAVCLRIALDSGPGALSVSDEVFAGLPATLKAVFTAKWEFEWRTASSTA